MNFESVNNELAALGCKQSHIDAFWRNWYLGRPLTQAKFTFPKAAAEAAATLGTRLAQVLMPDSDDYLGANGARAVLRASDGQLIESVLLPRDGVCISTQVGCAVGCRFCMTGRSGLVRQLSDIEIAAQVVYAKSRQKISKVVFMGMGEPSHNRRNVLSALDHITRYAGIGYKELVISTVGNRRLFEELSHREIKPALAISLHSAFDEKRRMLLPNAADLTVKEILDFGKEYARLSKYPIQYQWTLIRDLNDGTDEIDQLASLWDGQFAVLNMIPVNKIDDSPYDRPDPDRIEALKAVCRSFHILLKFRDSAAQDVDGGCGQLRARAMREKQKAVRDGTAVIQIKDLK